MARLSQREETRFRLERLVALLEQSTALIIGLGQYVPESDSNRNVMLEVIKSNRAVAAQEHDALHAEEMRAGTQIITLD